MGWNAKAIPLICCGVLCKAAVALIAREYRTIAQSLLVGGAIREGSTRSVKPWDSNPLANAHHRSVMPDGDNVPYHFMAEDDAGMSKW